MRSFEHLRRAPTLRRLSKLLPVLAIYGFAIALILTVWIGTSWQLQAERERGERDIAMEAANLTVVIEQNVIRTASELDRILKFLRKSYDRGGGQISWQRLVRDEYTINEHAVQIAVIDARGIMVTSTAMLFPQKPVDLSDREHFKYHAGASDDRLHISKPMIGRASGKWSVQFSRRLLTPDGAFDGVVVVSLDPSHIARTFGQLAIGSDGGVALVGIDGVVRAGTGRFESALGQGYREGEMAGGLSVIEPGTQVAREYYAGRQQIVASRRVSDYPLEVVVVADGLAQSRDWQKNKRNYVIVASVLTLLSLAAMFAATFSHRRNVRSLLKVARQDVLTGLANRVLFQERLEKAVAGAADDVSVALHLIDLDGFKAVNDTHGHPVGDKLLRLVAARLAAAVRTDDLLARLGGDEFALVQLEPGHADNALKVAERLRRQLFEPFDIDGIQVGIDASIGVAIAGRDAQTAADLIRSADLALYSAKVEGRGTVRPFDVAMSDAVRERRLMEAEIRQAIERGEFELYYQPIMRAASGRIVGCEALIRWPHPTRGMVPPMTFIPIAEEAGLIEAIGDWVLEQACRDAAAWPGDLKVTVNCSPRQFKAAGVIDTIRGALEGSGLPPRRLEIEITESMLMKRDETTTAQLAAIRELGVAIAMDDFGTGYSSLSYLQNFPIDCLKIDRSFLMSVEANENSRSIIKAIIALAGAFGMRTVAEGVETAAQLDMLVELGCTDLQGYYIGKPVPVADAMEVVARINSRAAIAA